MINDIRTLKDFKVKTFSGYKKADVINILFKSIDTKNIDASCNWLIECILSGYSEQIWKRLCIYTSKHININNTEINKYIYNKNKIFYHILNEYKQNKTELEIRNDRTILNLFISTIIIVIDSSKNFKYKIPKIKPADFNIDYVRERLTCPVNLLPDDKLGKSEPYELKLILNEIVYNLRDNFDKYDKCYYWIYWIIQWEKINLKNKLEWNILERNTDVDKKYRCDVIWLLWEIILDESKKKYTIIKKNINLLYNLYIFDFKRGDRLNKLPYLLNSILYLVKPITKTTLIKNIEPIIKCQCNIYLILKDKKKNEVKPEVFKKVNTINKEKKQIKDKKKIEEMIEKEKILLKLKDFNEISNIL
jgi:hypothetical protein